MGQLKPWQLVLIIAALLVLGGSVAFQVFSGKKINTPDEVMMIDVVSGDRFRFDTSGRRAMILPEKHPETGEYTLLPVHEAEDGSWTVSHMREVTLPADQLSAVIDLDRGTVRPSDAAPRTLKK